MSCDMYEKYELGFLEEETFKTHLKDCATCSRLVQQDQIILTAAQKLKTPVEAPHLWDRIALDIETGGAGDVKKNLSPSHKMFAPVWVKIAASLVIPIMLVGFYLIFMTGKPSGLLTQKALTRVEKMEREFQAAILELEKRVKPKFDTLDFELAVNYREKLEIIDEQIKLCRNELERNPTNTHLRRYLLAAMQDKKQTLMEIAGSDDYRTF